MSQEYKTASIGVSGLYLLVTAIGLVGNAMSILVFSHVRMRRSSINILLTAMSVSDFLLLLFALPSMGVAPLLLVLRPNASLAHELEAVGVVTVVPLSLTAQAMSTWILVLITIERFMAVCRPLAARTFCTTKRAKIATVAVVLLAVLYNVCHFFDYRLYYNEELQRTAATAWLYDDPLYWKIYCSTLYAIFLFLGPFTFLAVMNAYVIFALRKARRERGDMTQQQLNEHRTTLMMIVVVLFFLATNILPSFLNFFQSSFPQSFQSHTSNDLKDLMMLINDISNLIFISYCSANAFIYYFFSDRYRKIFAEIKQCKYHPQRRSYMSFASPTMMTTNAPRVTACDSLINIKEEQTAFLHQDDNIR